jgi:phosphinothricin acetyltransferase
VNDMPQIRLASPEDATPVLSIYGPYCAEDCPISFETGAPTLFDMQQRIDRVLARFPWLVYEDEGVIAGYAYATGHGDRAGYRWSVDTSIYIDPSMQRRGVARSLYTSLLAIVRLQGYVNAYAGISLPNTPSVALHAALGFQPVGIYRQVGYKGGAWLDVAWMQLQLQPRQVPPLEPTPLHTVISGPEFAEAINSGLRIGSKK